MATRTLTPEEFTERLFNGERGFSRCKITGNVNISNFQSDPPASFNLSSTKIEGGLTIEDSAFDTCNFSQLRAEGLYLGDVFFEEIVMTGANVAAVILNESEICKINFDTAKSNMFDLADTSINEFSLKGSKIDYLGINDSPIESIGIGGEGSSIGEVATDTLWIANMFYYYQVRVVLANSLAKKISRFVDEPMLVKKR